MGYTPALVVAPLRQRRSITDMHVFYGPPQDPKREGPLEAVRKVAESFDVKLHVHAVEDGFDYDQAMRSFVAARDQVPKGRRILFNASSGPRPMIMAAALFCHTHGLPLVYYDEYDTKEGRAIPLQAYRGLSGISRTKRSLLRRLQAQGPTDVGTLARKMGLANSTVSEHVKELHAEGILTVDKEGRRRVVRLTPAIKDLHLEAVA